jgi:hypothetical protein
LQFELSAGKSYAGQDHDIREAIWMTEHKVHSWNKMILENKSCKKEQSNREIKARSNETLIMHQYSILYSEALYISIIQVLLTAITVKGILLPPVHNKGRSRRRTDSTKQDVLSTL